MFQRDFPWRPLLVAGCVAFGALSPSAFAQGRGAAAGSETPASQPLSLTMEDAAAAPGKRTARVIARLNKPAPNTLYFRYITKNGDGTNEGTDYVRKSGFLVFRTGEQTKAIDVELLKDLAEGESVILIGGWPYAYPATAIAKGEARIAPGY